MCFYFLVWFLFLFNFFYCGVRPVICAELLAFYLRVRGGNIGVLCDADVNVLQHLRAEGLV